MGNHFRLLKHLLLHEVTMITLGDEHIRRLRFLDRPLNFAVVFVIDSHALARQNGPIAIFEIGDGIRERRKCDSVGTEEHFALTVTDGEWRPLACSDQEFFVTLKQESECEGTMQHRQTVAHGFDRRLAFYQFAGHQMRNRFGIGFRLELVAFRL